MNTGLDVSIRHQRTKYTRVDEPYGEWYEHYNNEFVGAKIADEPDLANCVIGKEVKPGDTVHIVWFSWSDGDSFGRADGSGVDVVAAYSDIYLARLAREKLINHETSGWDVSAWKCELELENGDKFMQSIPWAGYFEHLDFIRIETVVL